MNQYVSKPNTNDSKAATSPAKASPASSSNSFEDGSKESIDQKKIQKLVHDSAEVKQLRQFDRVANQIVQPKKGPVLSGQSAPVQRKIKFTKTNEEYTDSMAFLMKYGMGAHSKGIMMLQKEIGELIEKGEHEYDDITDMLTKLGYQPEQKEDKGITKKVVKVNGVLGSAPKIAEETVLALTKSKKQSSHALYELTYDSAPYMLKEEPAGKSEFQGLEIQDKHGVAVPPALSLTMDDGKTYLLMGFVKHLGEGLASLNQRDAETMLSMATELGRMHVADVRMGNVDRLPWRGNGHKGHLFNVFVDMLAGKIIGLDSESKLVKDETMQKDIKEELAEIKGDPGKYAEAMFDRLTKVVDKDKLNLSEKEVQEAFKKGFATGLAQVV